MSRLCKRGFTLVEMMVVIFVIGIIITIVVGVAGVVAGRAIDERTKTTMEIVMSAVRAYYDAQQPNAWPDEAAPAPPRDAQASGRCSYLLAQLKAEPKAVDRLLSLDSGSYGANGCIVDGSGKSLDYFRARGAGGMPLLLSAGRDNIYDNADDIRSDGR